MSQTAQHEARVKQLKEELARAKAELAAVGSLASTFQIHQAETHVPIQPPQLPEMPEFQGTEEDEQLRLAPGALNIREKIEQEIEDLPEERAKEYLMYEKKVTQSAALAFLQPEEQIKDFGTEFLPLPLMRHEAILWKEKMRPAVPMNEDGGYEGIPLTTEEAKTLIKDHPRWGRKWLSEHPRDLTNFHNTPQSLQIDPTYCPVPRRRSWSEFQKWKGKNKTLLNYPVLSAQEPSTVNYVVNTLNTTIQLLREVPDIACQMLVKISKMIVTCIQVFKDTEDDDHPWNLFLEGRRGICWSLRDSPTRWQPCSVVGQSHQDVEAGQSVGVGFAAVVASRICSAWDLDVDAGRICSLVEHGVVAAPLGRVAHRMWFELFVSMAKNKTKSDRDNAKSYSSCYLQANHFSIQQRREPHRHAVQEPYASSELKDGNTANHPPREPGCGDRVNQGVVYWLSSRAFGGPSTFELDLFLARVIGGCPAPSWSEDPRRRICCFDLWFVVWLHAVMVRLHAEKTMVQSSAEKTLECGKTRKCASYRCCGGQLSSERSAASMFRDMLGLGTEVGFLFVFAESLGMSCLWQRLEHGGTLG
ncbi:hypothetical protein L7F22_058088 [Adiantum nelumboides]|nr:hypothetical protein [Adiantum nelumboides]